MFFGSLRDIDQLVRLAAGGIDRKRLGEPSHLGGRHPEPRVLHLQRLEQPLCEKIRQALARGRLDHTAEQIDREAVFPDRAGLMRQRRLGEALDLLGRREIARVIVADARQIESGLGVGVLAPEH